VAFFSDKEAALERKPGAEVPYIHILRSFAIYLIIALHCVSPYLTDVALYGTRTWWVCGFINSAARSGVPIFLMISGFLLLSDSRTLAIKPFYIRRCQRLLLPFLCWDVIYFLFNSLRDGIPPALGRFLSELAVEGSKYHLWFVYQILAIYLLAPFLKRLLDACRTGEQWLFFMLLVLPTTILPFLNTVLPVYIAPFRPLLEGYVGYFVLGYLLGQQDLPAVGRWAVYCGGVAGLLLNAIGNYAASSPEKLDLIWNNGYAISSYLTAAAVFVWGKSVRWRWQGWTASLFRQLADASFDIYFSHALILELWRYLLRSFDISLSPAVEVVVSFMVTALVASLLALLLRAVRRALRRHRQTFGA